MKRTDQGKRAIRKSTPKPAPVQAPQRPPHWHTVFGMSRPPFLPCHEVDTANATIPQLLHMALAYVGGEGDYDPIECALDELIGDIAQEAHNTGGQSPLYGIERRLRVVRELYRRSIRAYEAQLDAASGLNG